MNTETNPVVTLSFLWLPLLALILIFCLALSLLALRRMVGLSDPPGTAGRQPDGLGSDAAGASFLHRWETRCKLASLIGFALVATSLTTPALILAALLLAGAISALAGLPWQRPLRRLQAINGFLVMLLLVLPLSAVTRPEDTLVVFGNLSGPVVNLRGLLLALTIIGKAWTVALLVEPMLATAPLATTMAGLSRLGLPRKLGQLLLITHRYLFVFCAEAARMHGGMLARGFHPHRSCAGLRDLANFLGMLLVRSYERTEQIQQAMLARGYTGQLPQEQARRIMPADWLGVLFVAALGSALLLADRLVEG